MPFKVLTPRRMEDSHSRLELRVISVGQVSSFSFMFVPSSFLFETSVVIIEITFLNSFFTLLAFGFQLDQVLFGQASTPAQFAIQQLILDFFVVPEADQDEVIK